MFRTTQLATLVAVIAAAAPAQGPSHAAAPKLTRPALSIAFEVDGGPVAFRIDGVDVDVDGDVLGSITEVGSASGPASKTVQVLDQSGALLATLHLDPAGLRLRFAARSHRAWLGVELQPIPPVLADHLELDPQAVALVARVRPDSPAARCGLAEHDIVLRVGDRESGDVETVHAALAGAKPGESLDFTVLRRGARKTLAAKLGREPVEDPARPGGVPFLQELPVLGELFREQAARASDRGEDFPRRDPALDRLLYDTALNNYFTQLQADPAPVYDRSGNRYLLPQASPGRDLTETDRAEGPAARLDRVEEQLARIEELLRKLEERRDN